MHQITEFSDTLIYDQRIQGRSLKMSDLWATRPTLLLFLRRLGCPICRNYAMQIQKNLPVIEVHGVQVVAVSFENLGEGSDSDKSFTKGKFWSGPLYQIDKQVYHALFGKKSIFGILDIDKQALADTKKNGVQGNYKGDGLTLGGQILVAPPNRIMLDHRQTKFGGDASLEEIMDAIQQLAA